MVQICACLLAMLFVFPAFGFGTDRGNGGGIISCVTNDREIILSRTLDLVEGQGREVRIDGQTYKLNIPLKTTHHIAQIKAVFDTFESLNSVFYKRYLKSEFNQTLTKLLSAIEDSSSELIVGDFKQIRIPQDVCPAGSNPIYRNVFIYEDGTRGEEDTVTRISRYFNSFKKKTRNETDIAALYTHEILYKQWRAKDSEVIREATAVVFSDLDIELKYLYLKKALRIRAIESDMEYTASDEGLLVFSHGGYEILNPSNIGVIWGKEIFYAIKEDDFNQLYRLLNARVQLQGKWAVPSVDFYSARMATELLRDYQKILNRHQSDLSSPIRINAKTIQETARGSNFAPLYYAIEKQNITIARFLVHYGADIRKINTIYLKFASEVCDRCRDSILRRGDAFYFAEQFSQKFSKSGIVITMALFGLPELFTDLIHYTDTDNSIYRYFQYLEKGAKKR